MLNYELQTFWFIGEREVAVKKNSGKTRAPSHPLFTVGHDDGWLCVLPRPWSNSILAAYLASGALCFREKAGGERVATF